MALPSLDLQMSTSMATSVGIYTGASVGNMVFGPPPSSQRASGFPMWGWAVVGLVVAALAYVGISRG